MARLRPGDVGAKAAVLCGYACGRQYCDFGLQLLRYGAYCFGCFLLALFGIGWLMKFLGGHLKTGQRRTLQNRPMALNQNKTICTVGEGTGANIFL